MAQAVAPMLATGADSRVQLFLETFKDMFRRENFDSTLEFFIASFSRARDDLGQWRAYADNGRGFAIGLSPRMFKIVDKPPPDRLPEFVGQVLYSIHEVCARNQSALEEAASIFLEAVTMPCRGEQNNRYSIHASFCAGDHCATTHLELSHLKTSGLSARARSAPRDYGNAGEPRAAHQDTVEGERNCALHCASDAVAPTSQYC